MLNNFHKEINVGGISKSEYSAIHSWIRSRYGKANKCEAKDCKKTGKRFDWALLRGKKYAKNVKNFWQLCRPCHKKYDYPEGPFKKAMNCPCGVFIKKPHIHQKYCISCMVLNDRRLRANWRKKNKDYDKSYYARHLKRMRTYYREYYHRAIKPKLQANA